jgi:hypothetical protein
MGPTRLWRENNVAPTTFGSSSSSLQVEHFPLLITEILQGDQTHAQRGLTPIAEAIYI